MHEETQAITDMILKAKARADRETGPVTDEDLAGSVKWPRECLVGPGLEGAVACATRVGYVNGSKGRVLYRGYDIFDLCAHSTYEEVAYLLLYGRLPRKKDLDSFKDRMVRFRFLPNSLRMMMAAPIEEMNPMSAMRYGVDMMRRRLTWQDYEFGRPDPREAIASDEDSIGMETLPKGEKRAIYEFRAMRRPRPVNVRPSTHDAASRESCLHLTSGLATIAACVARVRADKLPIDPDPELGHAANLLYMINGKRPTPEEERIMDVALILHADHGMNASTFASMVVASTLSDIYFSVQSGIAALNGPLHGGANEEVVRVLEEIGSDDAVEDWVARALRRKDKIPGFGHRVYKVYDPRARILGPLARDLARRRRSTRELYATASVLEKCVVSALGDSKGVFPNVDFYSGIVYRCLGVPDYMFTSLFAVSRVAGWTARVHEYLKTNRIFRPRAWYTGGCEPEFVPIDRRSDPPRKR